MIFEDLSESMDLEEQKLSTSYFITLVRGKGEAGWHCGPSGYDKKQVIKRLNPSIDQIVRLYKIKNLPA